MKPIYKIFTTYILILFLLLAYNNAFGQTKFCEEDICVVEFNAGWNESNSADYLDKLTDCGIKRINIDKGDWKDEYDIVIVPTVIVFNGEEVKRFQACLRFKIGVKREDVQELIDDLFDLIAEEHPDL